MKNQIESILIGLQETGQAAARENLIAALQIFEAELRNIDNAMTMAMHDCVDVRDFSKLENLKQLSALIELTCKNLQDIPQATRYKNPKCPKPIKSAKEFEEVTGRNPVAFKTEGKRIDLHNPTWLCLLNTVLQYLAQKSGDRFVEMMEEFNYTNGISFMDNENEKKRDYTTAFQIPAANKWYEYHGSAEQTFKLCNAMFEFFNLHQDFEILLSNQKRKKRK